MSYNASLEIAANWAAILTAILAAYAYGKYQFDRWQRVQKLEQHLRYQKLHRFDEGKRTILHLMANLSMTESEIVSAAFESKRVHSSVSVNDKGHADVILFEYDGEVGVRKPPH
jgi:hypothetical protein